MSSISLHFPSFLLAFLSVQGLLKENMLCKATLAQPTICMHTPWLSTFYSMTQTGSTYCAKCV